MWVSNKWPRVLNYSVNVKGAKSGNKVANAVRHYKQLQERVSFEGQTKWLENALERVLLKLRKYSININKI
ncbi:MAG: hypothetical protein ACD_49C00099G0001 [uncultured bacterium (gcode 4)]|uniref:Uncharacterized protein n=1 Tax=uncultured bacterium (gcode 4) TaxID=1234023 RepID=K2BU61_9BACT|nr:MAG: hypothetical protein ACD_49C00099G0001 [uncultured bacterium (gcode 4)]